MSRSKGECLWAVEEELAAAGASYRVVLGKSYKVWVFHRGEEHLYVCSRKSTNKGRAQQNSRAGIRRLLKQLGIIDP